MTTRITLPPKPIDAQPVTRAKAYHGLREPQHNGAQAGAGPAEPEYRPKHGVHIRWSRGANLVILSYAVWVNGICQVSHDTTRHMKIDKNAAVNREMESQGLPII